MFGSLSAPQPRPGLASSEFVNLVFSTYKDTARPQAATKRITVVSTWRKEDLARRRGDAEEGIQIEKSRWIEHSQMQRCPAEKILSASASPREKILLKKEDFDRLQYRGHGGHQEREGKHRIVPRQLEGITFFPGNSLRNSSIFPRAGFVKAFFSVFLRVLCVEISFSVRKTQTAGDRMVRD